MSIPVAPRPLSTIPAAPRPLPTTAAIDAGWQQWIAENRLRNCTPASMVRTMVDAGLDAQASAIAIAQMDNEPAFLAARRFQQLQRKLESVLENLQRLWSSAPHYAVVEKRPEPPLDEFVDRYVRGCRPLVITDVARDWPAMRHWSPADLKQRFGHLDVEIQAERSADPRFEENKLAHRRTSRLSVFVDQVLEGGPTNDYYMTANNEALRRPEFAPLLADVGRLPRVCDPAQLAAFSSFWFGPAGTVTPLHHDTLMLFHTQIVGRKRWRFISPLQIAHLYNHNNVFSPIDLDQPDLHRYPDFVKAQVLEVIVEPGETVFLPLGWWHQVTSLDVSLSFSYSNLALPNAFTYVNPEIHNW
jgi:Cupin-like domain